MTERNMRCGNNNTCIYHVGGEGGGGGIWSVHDDSVHGVYCLVSVALF